ncbi:hypothetical protein CA830_21470, partial [Burkholderia multivorans]
MCAGPSVSTHLRPAAYAPPALATFGDDDDCTRRGCGPHARRGRQPGRTRPDLQESVLAHRAVPDALLRGR